ncbi:MAG: DUF4350 domain-containing protein, partial [Chloroflexota bacterium]|nr:DUF4350 domain-containing protein [Chloroflexota bacterium]
LALLALLVLFAALRGEPQAAQPFDLDSPAPEGLRALRLWLERMAYRVVRMDNQVFELPVNADLLFIFPNQQPYTEAEARQLHQWVTQGHTLVLIGTDADDRALVEQFGAYTTSSLGLTQALSQQQPLLPDADASLQTNQSGVSTLDLTDAPSAVPVLANAEGAPTLAVQSVGQGVVWHLSLQHAPLNAALNEPDQARIVPALLREVPAGGTIVFDTYHLYGSAQDAASNRQIASLQDWLYRTPPGWASLFTLGATLLYLGLQGRRLGPALPTPASLRRREAAEYVRAMAALHQRAQSRTAVAHYHKRRLKRTLGRPLHLSADLSDAEFVQRLQANHPAIGDEQISSIRQLLNNLEQPPNEGALVRMVAEIDQMVDSNQ